MMAQPLRLLRRTHLLPGESLSSFLARLAKLNCYDPPSLLDRMCLARRSNYDRVSLPFGAETFEHIATLSGIDPKELYAATAHRFAPILTLPDGSPGSLILPDGENVPGLTSGKRSKQLRAEFTAQFCPECIREVPYHRLIWMPIAVSACAQHQCLLVDQCPACRTPLTVREIVDRRCGKCQANLVNARPIPIGKDALGLLSQQVIQSWLMGVPLSHQLLSHSFPDQPPAVLYSLMNGLCPSIINVRPGRGYMHKIIGGPPHLSFPGHGAQQNVPSDQNYRLFATAFKSILDWPDGFLQFLQAYCGQGKGEDASGVYMALGGLYGQWFEKRWEHPAFQFVREAFDEYLLKHCAGAPTPRHTRWCRGQPVKADRFAYATMAEAAQLLNMSPQVVRRLAKVGCLQFLKPPGPFGDPYQFVSRIEVLVLRHKWSEPLSLNEAIWWLGLSREVVLDLAKAGLLTSECQSSTDDDVHWLFNKQSVIDLWSAVMTAAGITPDLPLAMLDLRTATQMLKAVGLNAADIIERVAAGELRAYHSIPISSSLDALVFSQQDIQACVRRMKRKNKRKRCGDDPSSKRLISPVPRR